MSCAYALRAAREKAWPLQLSMGWLEFNRAQVAAAGELPTATVLDAGRTIDEVEHDVRHWIDTQLYRT